MTGLDHVETDRLREWLSEVRGGGATAALMLAIAYDRGISAKELASWYGRSPGSVESTIDAIDSPDRVAEIARLEGVDVEAVAAASDRTVEAVEAEYAELSERPVSDAASVIRDHAAE